MYKNGELEKVMTQFENVAHKFLRSGRLDREKRGIGSPYQHDAYYEDGETNKIFLGYLYGYALGKFEGSSCK